MKKKKRVFKQIGVGIMMLLLLCCFKVNNANAQFIYFADDFENGLGNWDVSGYAWDLTDSDSRSSTHSATDSPSDNYVPNANVSMTLVRPVDLTGSVSPVLSYWHKDYMPNGWDLINVEVSANGGLSWTALLSYGGITISTWTNELIDLSDYKTSSVLIRFRLRDNGDVAVADGWYIDDVEIKEADTGRLPFPFSDDFEHGLCNWEVSGYDWDLTDSDSHSLTHSATDSPNGNYPTNGNATMTLVRPVDLTGSVSPVLSYWHKDYMPNGWDLINVEVSANGGLSWTALLSYGAITISTWTNELIDLSDYKTSSVLIRFRLRDNGDVAVADGWYIDDVEIKELGQKLYYCDSDNDGYVASQPNGQCTGANCVPAGCQTTAGNDYDDDPNVHPGAAEVCGNDIDENCDGFIDACQAVRDDVIMDFGSTGSPAGVWVRYNDTNWVKLHSRSPEIMSVGDMDGSGQDDVIVDFGLTGSPSGVWVRYNDTNWVKLHSRSPEMMAVGNIDGSGQDDVIVDFGPTGSPSGVWVRYNDTNWVKLHSKSPEMIAVGDMDGSGQDDVIMDFGPTGSPSGVWVRYNDTNWVKLHSRSPEIMSVGDMDGCSQDDVIMDFGSTGSPSGVWVRYNDTNWVKLHSRSPEIMSVGDMDGSGQDDMIMDFGSTGSPSGVWVRYNDTNWVKLHTKSPEIIAVGDMDNNAQDDLIMDFGSSGSPSGLWVRYNDTVWGKLQNLTCESITTGNMDGN